MNEHETASFFERLKKGMQESIAYSRGELTLKTTALPAPPPPAGSAKVIALRKKLKMSQSVFAAALNVSTKLVQSWEQGSRKPERGDLRLIELLVKRPNLIRNLILSDDGGPTRKMGRKNGTASKKKSAA